MRRFKSNIYLISGLGILLNLLFFVLCFVSCRSTDNDVEIIWVKEQAKSIRFSEKIFAAIPAAEIPNTVHIRSIKDSTHTNILGTFSGEKKLNFEPLVPFTRGFSYEVLFNEKRLTTFSIPLADLKESAYIKSIYPEQDTLPENILKMYVHFSTPMREGVAGDLVRIIKQKNDTLNNVFLNLEPELWNEDRTVLTLWFDPGRIKRDLQPNLKLGNPLQKNSSYTLFISKQWQNVYGQAMKNDITKTFWVSQRDSLSPNTMQWILSSPKIRSKESFSIEFHESLDHYLLLESLSITDSTNKKIQGKWEIQNQDRGIQFIPTNNWEAVNYTLNIASKLEDLAGNNLLKVFDRDITQSKKPVDKAFFVRTFKVHE